MTVREIIERTYTDTCVIRTYQNSVSSYVNTLTPALSEPVPCRLSHQTIQPAAYQYDTGEQKQTVKLFVSPDINFPPGSEVIVTHDGITAEYELAGFPAVYKTHQEILLTLKDRWT